MYKKLYGAVNEMLGFIRNNDEETVHEKYAMQTAH